MILNLKDLSVVEKQNWLQHAIAPRPIGLISTIDIEGNPNLAPFSFFNLFSSEPPIVIFSPARRVRDNTTKHTLDNIYATMEAVVHIVTFDMVQQVSLASCEYPLGVDEFIKVGFTKEKAIQVKPPMVKESPIKLECKVLEVKPLGTNGGAGNLVIAEVVLMHVDETVLTENKSMIDQTKVHHVARLGSNWYAKIFPQNLFEVTKPNVHLGIGFDNLPKDILESTILTNNHKAQLANSSSLPDLKSNRWDAAIHQELTTLLDHNKVDEAWMLLQIN